METAGAYGRLAAGAPGSYEREAAAVDRLDHLIESGKLGAVLFNSLEASVGSQYLAISTLLAQTTGSRRGVFDEWQWQLLLRFIGKRRD